MAPVDNRPFRHFEDVDHGDLFGVLLRGRWLAILVFIVVTLLGAAYVFLAPATYEWRAIVQLKTDDHLLQRLGLADERKSQEKLAKEQLKELSSSAVLLSAIQALQVTDDAQNDYSAEVTANSFDEQSSAPNLNTSTSALKAYKQLKDSLSIGSTDVSTPNEQIFELSYQSRNVETGPAFLEAVIAAYLGFLENEHNVLEEANAELLEARLPSIENNVLVARELLARFQANNPGVRLPLSLRTLLADSVEAEVLYSQLRLQRDLLQTHYGSDHFLFEALDGQLSNLKTERYELDELLSGYTGPEAQLLRLQRDLEVSEQLYDAIRTQLHDSQAAVIIDADVSVSPPVVVKPQRKLLLAVSMLLGLMLGVFVVLIRAFLRPAVYSGWALQDLTQLNTTGVPDAKLHRSWCACLRRRSIRTLLTDKHSSNPALESMRALRATFAEPANKSSALKLAFVGPTADVGKTFVAANTAALLALEGKRVLLIDADMRRSGLHEYLGYESGLSGLAQVLSGQAATRDVLIEPCDGLTVLPAGQRPTNPTELLLQPEFAALLEELNADYDYIIFTTPPILPVADTLAILRHVDAGYMVVRADQSSLKEVYDALERLYAASVVDVLQGAVLNGVKHLGFGEGIAYKQYYTYG